MLTEDRGYLNLYIVTIVASEKSKCNQSIRVASILRRTIIANYLSKSISMQGIIKSAFSHFNDSTRHCKQNIASQSSTYHYQMELL